MSRGGFSRVLRAVTAWAAFALVVGLVAPAAADTTAAGFDEQARSAFARGQEAEDKRNAAEAIKHFEEAASAFEQADAIEPHPETKFNVATAREKAGDGPRAADAYSSALAGGLDGRLVKTARSHLDALEKKLGVIEITDAKGARVSFAHRQHAVAPLRTFVRAGAYEISFEWAGKEPSRVSVEARAGSTTSVSAPDPPMEAAPLRHPPTAPPPLGPRSHREGVVVAGWVTFGLSVAAAGTAVGLGAGALKTRNDFVDGGNVDADKRDLTLRLQTGANVAWSVAGAAAVTSIVLLAVGYTGERKPVASADGIGFRF